MQKCAKIAHLLAASLFAVIAVTGRSAHATVVERVVAIIGERAILLSDLRERARPFLLKVHAEVMPGPQRAAAISQLYKTLLERMVDEELEQRAANKARIAVTAKEVDDALARIAAQNHLTVQRLTEEAERSGLNERQYRAEIRRQVLEAKLLNLRLQGRIRVSDDDLRQAYNHIVLDERRKQRFRATWIRIDVPRGASHAESQQRRLLAEQIAERARAGEDFAALCRQYSSDPVTRDTGGDLGEVKPGQLAPELDRIALTLESGEVSRPFRVSDSFVIFRVSWRQASELPTYEEAKDELAERVYVEKMNKAKQQWIEGLRKRTHIEIRW